MNVQTLQVKRVNVDMDLTIDLMTVKEAKYLDKKGYELATIGGSFWLRDKGLPDKAFTYRRAAGVGYYGAIYEFGFSVSTNTTMVRPVLRCEHFRKNGLHIGDYIIFGGQKFEVVMKNLALCTDSIGQGPFSKDESRPGADEYEKSDLKGFVDMWFQNAVARKD